MPMKIITIPRLELTTAVVSVTVIIMLREEFFWTDSKGVLGYINNDARRFHTFVANRVQKICHASNPSQWFYVATDENLADSATRGKTDDELLLSDWFTGPRFLWKREIKIPAEVFPELPIGDPEVR